MGVGEGCADGRLLSLSPGEIIVFTVGGFLRARVEEICAKVRFFRAVGVWVRGMGAERKRVFYRARI